MASMTALMSASTKRTAMLSWVNRTLVVSCDCARRAVTATTVIAIAKDDFVFPWLAHLQDPCGVHANDHRTVVTDLAQFQTGDLVADAHHPRAVHARKALDHCEWHLAAHNSHEDK